ncbi:MAG: hypothetical protein QNJ41_01520 [Xenococcaceae cyanobacterium MO_188.B32]|nr:hypothetical protein [Xenococcaceae cyanobacterium MO_188.B32]
MRFPQKFIRPAQAVSVPADPAVQCARFLIQKIYFSRLRGWFGSLVAVQGDLPVITAESRHCFFYYGLSPF